MQADSAILGRILDDCPTPVLRVDDAGILQWANDAATSLLTAWRVTSGGRLPAPWASRFATIARSGDPAEVQATVEGRRLLLRVQPSGTGVVVYAREAAGDETQLGSAILANMSHELRTPLNAIVGYAELLEDELCDRGDQDLLDDVRKITRSAGVLQRMIGDLLEVARVEAGRAPLQVDRFELGDLIDDVALSFAPKVEANGNALDVRLNLASPWIDGDAAKVRRVLSLLVENATKFTRAGTVTIEAELSEGADRVRLVVRDTGIGMDRDQVARLFRPFQQADPSARRRYGGTGLGLALVRVLVEQMLGQVSVESEPGRGSVFTVELPVRLIAG